MLDILKSILIVGGGVFIIVFFLLLIYSLIFYFKIVKISNTIKAIIWNIRITKVGASKIFYFFNYVFKKDGIK